MTFASQAVLYFLWTNLASPALSSTEMFTLRQPFLSFSPSFQTGPSPMSHSPDQLQSTQTKTSISTVIFTTGPFLGMSICHSIDLVII